MSNLKYPNFKTPTEKMTDKSLLNARNRIVRYIRSGGGGMFGFDWTTAKINHPELVEKYQEFTDECRKRLDKTQGILNGVAYQKLNGKWQPLQE